MPMASPSLRLDCANTLRVRFESKHIYTGCCLYRVRDGEVATRQRDASMSVLDLIGGRGDSEWDRHVYRNDVSTRGIRIYRSRANLHTSSARARENGRRIRYGGMVGHGYGSVCITPHDVCNQPPITVQIFNKSPILKRYCRDHVPSTAEFGLSGGGSPASTRVGVGKLAAVWGIVNTGSHILRVQPNPRGREAKKKLDLE